MPLTGKGREIMHSMEETYPSKTKAEEVFYASKNAGKISGVDGFNEEKEREAEKEGAVKSHDDNFGTMKMEAEQLPAADSYAPVGGGKITLAEISRQGQELWGGKDGNVGSLEGNASSLPAHDWDSRPIPVYKGMQDAADEVSPTQSDPSDARSDNLLSREHGGIPGTDGISEVVSAAKMGHTAGEKIAEGKVPGISDASDAALPGTMKGISQGVGGLGQGVGHAASGVGSGIGQAAEGIGHAVKRISEIGE